MIARVLAYAPLPLLLLLAAVEWAVLRRRGARFSVRESLCSLAIAAGHRVAAGVTLIVVTPLLSALWRHRVATVPLDRAWGVALLFLSVELAYYWQHRLSHAVRWLWASHSVHHTTREITITAAYRLAWTDLLSGTPLFLVPLVPLGFAPPAVLLMVAFVMAYQLWIHTETVPRLGLLDAVLNSPSNHRVHHASDDRYRGKNFGAVLVVFDRLFGTYAREDEAPRRYGSGPGSDDPLVLVFREWRALLADLRRARSVRGAIAVCFGPPEG
jgi:sterol desaturase/sphingolipid hydroxylase (fatty acid hydroxylase superfamily)